MADPLSVMASIAGVATAGITISIALYDITFHIKRAPKQVAEMAKELSLLSSILRIVKNAMGDNAKHCKPRLLQDLKSMLGKIKTIHGEVKDLTKDSARTMYRLKLVFKSTKTKSILAKIEAFKASLNIILAALQIASSQAQAKTLKETSNAEAAHLRRLLEAMIINGDRSIMDVQKSLSPHANQRHPLADDGEDIREMRSSRPGRFKSRSVRFEDTVRMGTRARRRTREDFSPRPGTRDHSIAPSESSRIARPRARITSSDPSVSEAQQLPDQSFEVPQVPVRKRREASQYSYYESDEDEAYRGNRTQASRKPEYMEEATAASSSRELILYPKRAEENQSREAKPRNVQFAFSKTSKNEENETNQINDDHPKSESTDEYSSEASDNAAHAAINYKFRPQAHGHSDIDSHRQNQRSYLEYYNTPALWKSGPPDDIASWLYRLVFLDSIGPMPGHTGAPLDAVSSSRIANTLLLEWTSADATQGTELPADEGYFSESKEDHLWESEVKHLVDDLAIANNFRSGIDWTDSSNSDSDIYVRHRRRERSPISRTYYQASEPFRDPSLADEFLSTRDTNTIQTLNKTIKHLEHAMETAFRRNERLEEKNSFLESRLAGYQELQSKNDAAIAAMTEAMQKQKLSDTQQAQFKMSLTEEKHNLQLAEIQKKHLIEIKEMHAKAKAEADHKEAYKSKSLAEEDVKKKAIDSALYSTIVVSFPGCSNSVWEERHVTEIGLQVVLQEPTSSSKAGIGGAALWKGPSLVNSSEMFENLKRRQWKPLWMRGSNRGETWFLGDTAVLVNFFTPTYPTQAGTKDKELNRVHGGPIWWEPAEDEYAAVGMGLVEREAIDALDLPYKGQTDGTYRFDVTVTYIDIENLVATSMLMREGRLRKQCRAKRVTANGSGFSTTVSAGSEPTSSGAAKNLSSTSDNHLRPRQSDRSGRSRSGGPKEEKFTRGRRDDAHSDDPDSMRRRRK